MLVMCMCQFVCVCVYISKIYVLAREREIRLILHLLCIEFSNSHRSLFKAFQDCLEVK